MKDKDRINIFISSVSVIISVVLLGSIVYPNLLDITTIKGIFAGVLGAIVGMIAGVILSRYRAKKNAPSIFISYNHNNKDIANKIVNELDDISNKVWIDSREINIGDSVSGKIEEGLQNSDIVMLILSKDTQTDNWVNAEYLKATELDKFIIPVKTDNSEIPEFLKDIAYTDLSNSFNDGILLLKRSLNKIWHNQSFHRTRFTRR